MATSQLAAVWCALSLVVWRARLPISISPTVVAGANRLFRDVLNQVGWLSSFGLTKTAYLFEIL